MSTIPTESLKFTEARARLSSILDRVFQQEVRIRIYKGNTPVAAIISIKDLERLEAYELRREQAFQNMERISEAFRDVDPEELQMRVDEAVAQVRAERDAKRRNPDDRESDAHISELEHIMQPFANLPSDEVESEIARAISESRARASADIGRIAEGFRDVTPEEFERQLELAKAQIRAAAPDRVPAGNA